MNSKPIGPRTHGLIDHGLAALHFLAPTVFRLRGSARSLCYFFGSVLGGLNLFTDHSVSLKRLIPFRTHGRLEARLLPALLLLPWLRGAFQQRNARRVFLPLFIIAALNFFMTDYTARERVHLKRDSRGRFLPRNGRAAPKRRQLATARHA